MRKIDENNAEAPCRCTVHREFTPSVTHHPQTMSASTRGLRFTPDMIRDQEMLVSSMSQQGMSEDLIRRQFERLLEEQSKQLRFMKDEPVTDKADPEKLPELKTCSPKTEIDPECSHNVPSEGLSFVTPTYYTQLANQAEVCRVGHCQETVNQLQSQAPMPKEKPGEIHPSSNAAAENNAVQSASPPKIEPSSLLKIRLKKEALNSSKRNNGLQEAATALKIIKDSKSKIAQDRLSTELESLAKLNGTQERRPGEQAQFNHHITERDARYNNPENQGKVTPANGLENSRNLNNPPYRRYHPHSPAATVHAATPSSAHSDKLTEPYPHPSSAAAQATAVNAHQLQPTPQQANDSFNKESTPYFELQEPKVIGGFTYFARKSRCMPKISGITYDFSTDHPNHQISSQSKPRTTLSISH